jgi:D-alanine-D-alanine ligase-like ATP-grasp enzyme
VVHRTNTNRLSWALKPRWSLRLENSKIRVFQYDYRSKEGRRLSDSESKEAIRRGYNYCTSMATGDLTLCSPPLEERCDILFPFLDEWGRVGGLSQSLVLLAGIPFVGCGVLSTGVCLHKPTSRAVFSSIGIPQVRYVPRIVLLYTENPESIVVVCQARGVRFINWCKQSTKSLRTAPRRQIRDAARQGRNCRIGSQGWR